VTGGGTGDDQTGLFRELCGFRPADRSLTSADRPVVLDAASAVNGAAARLARDHDDGPWHD
jgi:hypothetical protein